METEQGETARLSAANVDDAQGEADISEDVDTQLETDPGADDPAELSAAYIAFEGGDYAYAATLVEETPTTTDDPVDVRRALSLDPAIPITGAALAVIWVVITFSVL